MRRSATPSPRISRLLAKLRICHTPRRRHLRRDGALAGTVWVIRRCALEDARGAQFAACVLQAPLARSVVMRSSARRFFRPKSEWFVSASSSRCVAARRAGRLRLVQHRAHGPQSTQPASKRSGQPRAPSERRRVRAGAPTERYWRFATDLVGAPLSGRTSG